MSRRPRRPRSRGSRMRRCCRSRSEVTMPTRDSPTRTIGNSMIIPKTRNIVVTKSKYGPAANWARDVVRERRAGRSARTAGRDRPARPPWRRTASASGIHGRTVFRSAGVRPGCDERPDLVQQDRHRQDDPDDDARSGAGSRRRRPGRGPGPDRTPVGRAAGSRVSSGRRSREPADGRSRPRSRGSPGTGACAARRGDPPAT